MDVDLCGHATLATASYLFESSHPDVDQLQFWTRSGWLTADRHERGYTMDFPSEPLRAVEIDPVVVAALGVPVIQAFRATDLVYVVEDAATMQGLTPDLGILGALPVRGVVVTAPGGGAGYDFVSRWFGALAGVAEDPFTGSAHSQIAPFWAERLGKTTLRARQLSARGGTVLCEVGNSRLSLTSTCVRYLEGRIQLPGTDT
jgi:predicted PhzF superfamily epimerase YddE/YHI9